MIHIATYYHESGKVETAGWSHSYKRLHDAVIGRPAGIAVSIDSWVDNHAVCEDLPESLYIN